MEGYSRAATSLLKKAKIQVGGRIQVKKGKLVVEGLLMPRIELGDKNSLIIKLDNGYNTGIKVTSDVKVKKLPEKRELERFPKIKLKFNPALPSISMISTGGTISARVDYKTGGVTFLMDPKEILFTAPELSDIVNLVEISSPFKLASEDMTPLEWVKISEEAAKKLNKDDIKGVIVTHGTDTLHYTAAALSFMLRCLNKPVALVGAQRSPDRGSFDGTMNLLCASHYTGYSNIAEVAVVMHATANDNYCFATRGTKVRKMHTSRRDAFRPINDYPLAKIWQSGKIEQVSDDINQRNNGKVRADTKFDPRIAIVKIFPGMDPAIIDWYSGKVKGLILEGTGLGHLPSYPLKQKNSLFPAVKRALDKGVFVGMTAQTVYGRVHSHVYHNAIELEQMGVVYLGDMLPETAYVKLGWVLGHTKDTEEVKYSMLMNIAGEFNKRHEPGVYLL
jgi:glutamyl-tRNA(Gln) amidotransferase subunit D